MAQRAQVVSLEGVDRVDTEKRYPLGTIIHTGDAAYMYVQGVASGASGKWATVTSAGVTTLTVADANGLVGIFKADLDATTKYGFLQIFGKNEEADVAAAVTAGGALYLTSTAGRLDGTDVAADMVLNAIALSDDSSNVATVFLNYPHVIDAAID